MRSICNIAIFVNHLCTSVNSPENTCCNRNIIFLGVHLSFSLYFHSLYLHVFPEISDSISIFYFLESSSQELNLRSITNFLAMQLRDTISFFDSFRRPYRKSKIRTREFGRTGVVHELNRDGGPTLVFDPVRYLDCFAQRDLAPI